MPRPGATRRPPNILVAVADDLSFPHLSAYGSTWVRTPAFDAVAQRGLLFTRAYTPNAKCSPSRASLLTGRNSWQLEEAGNHEGTFPEKFKTYVEVLADHGYFVGKTGKGWAPGDPGMRAGVRREPAGRDFSSLKHTPLTSGISPIDYAANFKAFLAQRSPHQPWAFWFGSLEPHRKYEFQSGITKGHKDPATVAVPAFLPDEPIVRVDLLDYALEVEHFDRQLGQILQALEATGELENTLVVVTSDNGMPFPRAKSQEYEYSNHIPLAVMWPHGIKHTGRRIDDFVSLVDLAPTFLETAGLTAARAQMAPVAGISLMDIFASHQGGRVSPNRDHVLIGKERHDVGRPNDVGYPIRGIVKDGMLYLRNYEPTRWPAGNPETDYLACDGSPTKTLLLDKRRKEGTNAFWAAAFGKRADEELYSLLDDPACMHNLAASGLHTPIKDRLRAQMEQQLRAQGDPRMFGNGSVFDTYPNATPNNRDYYHRYRAGLVGKAGWVESTDYELDPID